MFLIGTLNYIVRNLIYGMALEKKVICATWLAVTRLCRYTAVLNIKYAKDMRCMRSKRNQINFNSTNDIFAKL